MKKLLFKNCNIYDGTFKMKLKSGYDILVENDYIKKIGKDLNCDNAKVINMNGAFCVPGLINLHVHLPAGGKLTKTKVEAQHKLVSFIKKNNLTEEIGVAVFKKYAQLELYSGTTTIRAVGGVGSCDTRLRDKINSKKIKGPRIVCCNEAIGVEGGHMNGTVAVPFKTIEDAVNRVNELKNQGVDWIKLMITGGVLDSKKVGYPGDLKMPLEMVKAVCDKAHSLGFRVAAHDEGPEGIEVAIKGGVDSIEHGSFVKEEMIKEFKKNNGVFVITLSPCIPLAFLPESVTGYSEAVKINTLAVFEGMKNMTNQCLKFGIPVGLGTDVGCPLVTHYDMYRELVYYEHYFDEVDKNFALYSATLGNAKILNMEDKIGSIEENKFADFFFVEKDPLLDLNNLSKPLIVVKDGEIFKKKIKKYPDCEKILNDLYLQISK